MKLIRVSSCSERIQTALKLRGLRQYELCKLTNIPKSAMSQYISGNFEPKQDRIYLMAQALNVSEAWLMGLDVPMERTEIKQNAPGKVTDLSEGEMLLVELFRQLPEDSQKIYLEVLRQTLLSRRGENQR